MKTFTLSYLASVSMIILVSLPAIKAAPLDTIPRISFYFGFPLAIVLSIGVIGLSYLIKGSMNDSGARSTIINPEEGHRPVVKSKVA